MWYDDVNNPIAFYHESTYRAVTAVVNYLKNVYIVRNKKNGELNPHRVPLLFEGKDVYVQYKHTPKEKLDRNINEVLPAMSLGMPFPPQPFKESGIVGDPKLNQCINTGKGQSTNMYSGRPFQLSFDLTLRAKLLHELFNMYEIIMSRLWRDPATIPILETELNIKRDLYIGDVQSRWGEYNPNFEKGKNSRPVEIIIGFTVAPFFIYPPITQNNNIIKHIFIDYKNLCADDPENTSFVLNRWDVDPEIAEEDESHDQILTQTLFDEEHVIEVDEVNKD